MKKQFPILVFLMMSFFLFAQEEEKNGMVLRTKMKKSLFILFICSLTCGLFGKELDKNDFIVTDKNENIFYLMEPFTEIKESLGEPHELLYSFLNPIDNNVQDGYRYDGIDFYMTDNYKKWNTERIVVTSPDYFIGKNKFQIGTTTLSNILKNLGHSNLSLYTDPEENQILIFYKLNDPDLFPDYYDTLFRLNGVFYVYYTINNVTQLLEKCVIFFDYEM